MNSNILDVSEQWSNSYRSDHEEDASKTGLDLSLSSDQRPRISADRDSYRMVVALNYGVSFTSMAYALFKGTDFHVDTINIVDDWSPKMGNLNKVPSVYSYSLPSAAGEEQWGASISPEAIITRNTMLELDVSDITEELELVLQTLDETSNLDFEHIRMSGRSNVHITKSPEQVVVDYLTKVLERFKLYIDHFDWPVRDLQHRMACPVDVVITFPPNWSYDAQNSLFRAARTAGVNAELFPTLQNVIMVNVTEAATNYVLRCLQRAGQNLLKMGECFIVCDIGDDSTYALSYQITGGGPDMKFKQASVDTVTKAGSLRVDECFRRWLRRTIGIENYRILDPEHHDGQSRPYRSQGPRMSHLMTAFHALERRFSHSTHDMKLDLPVPFDHLNIPGKVQEGELTISYDEMRRMFDPTINEILGLIQGQVQQVEERKHRRVKNVVIVGDFAESPYLRHELDLSMKLRHIKLRYLGAVDCSNATVKGAVIHGAEKHKNDHVTYAMSFSTSYALVSGTADFEHNIRFQGQHAALTPDTTTTRTPLLWLIRRGDMIIKNATRRITKDLSFIFRWTEKRVFSMSIYEYAFEDDDLPFDYETGQDELVQIASFECDLTPLGFGGQLEAPKFEQYEDPKNGATYIIAHGQFVLEIRADLSLEAEVYCDHKVVGRASIAHRYRDQRDPN